MNQFVRGLFIDLQNRVDKMTVHLNGITMPTKVGSAFKKDTVNLLDSVRGKIIDVFEKGILDVPSLLPNVIIKYNSIENEVMEIELIRYLAISKYDVKADGYFEKLTERIYKEIESFQTLPFVSTFSNSDVYYWAETGAGMIALPQGEEKNLLNLSDLYHEIGHFLFEQYAEDFAGNFFPLIDPFYGQEKRKIFSLAPRAIKKWKTTWVEEFSCDMIATYLCGSAYAWTHLKLCTISSSDVFGTPEFKTVHPSNESRMRAICLMLELTGLSKERLEVERVWSEFKDHLNIARPENYDDIYPQVLLDQLSQNVLEGCTNIALRSYTDQVKKFGDPISLYVNDGWDLIRTRPDSFRDWEVAKIADLGYVG